VLKINVGFIIAVLVAAVLGFVSPAPASAALSPGAVDLGTAGTFSIVAGSYVTLAGSHAIGDVGAVGGITVDGASSVTGSLHPNNDPTAQQARIDVSAAYGAADASGPSTNHSGTLEGQTLGAGVYNSVTGYSMAAGGVLTLDGGGDPDAVFILKTDGAIVIGASAQVVLINQAKAYNVFWQTPAHATFGASTQVIGTVLAASYIVFGAGTTLSGRAFSKTGYVTMSNTVVDNRAALVPVATVSGAPTSVSAVGGNASATVSWSAPADNGGAAISGYTVTSSPGGFTATTTGALSVAVSGLTNGTAYTFTVVATNSVGNSTPSPASNSVTPATVPDPPTSVSAAAGNASATVTWTAPVDNGGAAISGYTVTSAPGGFTATTAGALSVAVSGLTNGTAYTFTVVATNVKGNSTPSTATSPATTPTSVATVPSAPTAPSAVGGNASATVTWSAPITGGSPITGYIVTSTPAGATATISTGTTATSFVFPGLTNGTAYTFTVVATNGVGNSTPSPASNSVIPATVPDPPTSVSAAAGDASATVTWFAPVDNGGSAITSYTVKASSNLGFTSSFVTGTTATSVVFPGLTNGGLYTFTVVATNVKGNSDPSTATSPAIVPTSPATVPSAPLIPFAIPGDQLATVTWSKPASNGGSPITGYTVTSTPAGATASISTGTGTNLIFTGLTNGVSYTFKVVATNLVGDSLPSLTSNAVTPATGGAGATGATGPAGTAGTAGTPGIAGAAGTPGIAGAAATAGAAGIAGATGTEGSAGTAGATGTAGANPVAGPGTQVGGSTSGDNWLRSLLSGGSWLGSTGGGTPDASWLWAFVQPSSEATPAAITAAPRGEKHTVIRQLVANKSWQVTEREEEEIAALGNRRWAEAKRHENLDKPYQNTPVNPTPSAIMLLDLFSSRA